MTFSLVPEEQLFEFSINTIRHTVYSAVSRIIFFTMDQGSNINQCLLFILIFLFLSFRVQKLYPLFPFSCQETIFLSSSISSSIIHLWGHVCDVDHSFFLFPFPLGTLRARCYWWALCTLALPAMEVGYVLLNILSFTELLNCMYCLLLFLQVLSQL